MSQIFDRLYDDYGQLENEIELLNGEDNLTDEKIAKKLLTNKVNEHIEENRLWIDDERMNLSLFLDAVLPKNRKKYYIYITDHDGTRIHPHFQRKAYINALCALIDYPATIYYHLTSFVGWTTDENISGDYRSICVDIDDIDFPFDTKTVDKDELKQFLVEKYNLQDMPMFHSVALSGNGCHIYFCFNQMNDVELRQKYVDSLLVWFGGDVNTRPPSHKFRLPCSLNLKDPDNPKKSRLFIYDRETEDISYLDPYLTSPEEIKVYFAGCKDRSTEKRKKTMEKNRLKKINELKEQGLSDEEIEVLMKPKCGRKKKAEQDKTSDKKKENKSAKKSSSKSEVVAAVTDEPAESSDEQMTESTQSVDENIFDFESLHYKTIYSDENYCHNVLIDLHNYLKRHGNDALVGKRNFFFHCLASFAQRTRKYATDCDGFIAYCEKNYVPKSHPFYKEMVDIIRLTYRSRKKYKYRLSSVARRLEFTEQDYLLSHNSFNEEIRAERRSQYNHDYYEKNKNKQIEADKAEREAIIQFIADNPELKRSVVCDIFAISKATYYRYKEKAKTDKAVE